MLRSGGGQDVHRIVDRRFRVELLPEEGRGLFRQRRHDHPALDQLVGGNDGRPARIGDHADPIARRHRLRGETDRRLAQLLDVAEGHDARLLEHVLDSRVLLHQPPGV